MLTLAYTQGHSSWRPSRTAAEPCSFPGQVHHPYSLWVLTTGNANDPNNPIVVIADSAFHGPLSEVDHGRSVRSKVNIALDTPFNFFAPSYSVTVPVSELVTDSGFPSVATRRLTLRPLSRSAPLLYPIDWYGFDIRAFLSGSDDLRLGLSGDPGATNSLLVPLQLRNDLVGFDIADVRPGTDVRFEVTRDLPTKLYTLALSLALVPLVAVIGQLVFRSSRLEFNSLLVGLLASLLVILPLRLVIVPSDVHGMTLVDPILGVEFLTILLVVLIRYARESGSRPQESRGR
jgi:hypothetical protein